MSNDRSRQLELAYRRAHYDVQGPDVELQMRIDTHCPQLLQAHERAGVEQSAFITAWNPRSEPRGADENASAHLRLCARLEALRFRPVAGWGRDPLGTWPAEQSLWVPGIPAGVALGLGAEFGQHAIVHAGADGVPRLLWVERPG